MYEIRGVPLISSPWFSSTASRSMDASPLAVTARHGRDSEQTGRMLMAEKLKHNHTHTMKHIHMDLGKIRRLWAKTNRALMGFVRLMICKNGIYFCTLVHTLT